MIHKKLNNNTFYGGCGKLNSVKKICYLVEKYYTKKNIHFKNIKRNPNRPNMYETQ